MELNEKISDPAVWKKSLIDKENSNNDIYTHFLTSWMKTSVQVMTWEQHVAEWVQNVRQNSDERGLI